MVRYLDPQGKCPHMGGFLKMGESRFGGLQTQDYESIFGLYAGVPLFRETTISPN